MDIPLYQIDAFASRPFEGNPAGVCPLPANTPWPDDAMLLAIAAENNLSETAFFMPEGKGYRLRWFTPAVEVDLCGHATLATSWALFNKLGHTGDAIEFETWSGRLVVRRDGDAFTMDFPANPASPLARTPDGLADAIGAEPEAMLETKGGHGYYVAVLSSAEAVAKLQPNFPQIAALDSGAVIVTAPGGDTGYDFVSRMFAPLAGIDEDPVTGSAHCVLAPYWAGRLGKRALSARQVSARGGDVGCIVEGDRVILSGRAALYMQGQITI